MVGGRAESRGREGNHGEIEGKGGGKEKKKEEEGGKLFPGQDWLEIAAARAGGACGPRSPPGCRAEPRYGLGGTLGTHGASYSIRCAAGMAAMNKIQGERHARGQLRFVAVRFFVDTRHTQRVSVTCKQTQFSAAFLQHNWLPLSHKTS